jgi:WD40 repeat protein
MNHESEEQYIDVLKLSKKKNKNAANPHQIIQMDNFKELQEIYKMEGHKGSVLHIVKLTDKKVITSGEDKQISIWDIERGKRVTIL